MLDNVTNFTNTLSPIFSSLSPFLTDPVSERLETDSLFVRGRLEDGVAGVAGVVEEAFLVAVVGDVDFVAGVCEDTLPTEGVGDAAREGGAVSVPLASPSVRDNLDGRVKIPRRASHWK